MNEYEYAVKLAELLTEIEAAGHGVSIDRVYVGDTPVYAPGTDEEPWEAIPQ